MNPLAALLALLLPDRYGRRWLRNALDAVDAKLLNATTLAALLLDWQAECAHVAADGDGWPVALVNVCTNQSTRPGRTPRSYVLAGPETPVGGHVAQEWTNLMAGDAWTTHHVDKTRPSHTPWPSFPQGQDQRSLQEFQAFVARKDWFVRSSSKDGAWIGRPSDKGAICWVSTAELDAAVGASPQETNGCSRQVAWALGLSHTPDKARVRYRMDAVALRAERDTDGRRPTPADGPIGWFRTQVAGARGQHFNDLGWGATVNLEAIHQDRVESDGRPEQVIASVAVDNACILGLDCLLSAADDKLFHDPEAAFDNALHGAQPENDVIAALQARLAALAPP